MQARAARKWPLWLAGILFALIMLPLFLGAWGAFPAADDFVYVTRTHQTWVQTRSLPHVLVDAWRYARQIYGSWQGTFVGCMVMALGPAVFTIAGYGAHAWLLLIAYLGAQYLLVRAACARVLGLDRRMSAFLFFALTALQWIWIPDLLEGLYWYNGAWFYTMAHAGWMLVMSLAISLPGTASPLRRRLGYALLCLCCAALGLDNYITAMLALCSHAFLFLFYWFTERRHALALLPALLLLAAGLAISVLAPGNAVRLATETQFAKPEPWLPLSAWKTLLAAGRLAARFCLRTPLLACCTLAAPWLYGALRASGRAFRRPLLVCLCAFLALCAMIFPHLYSTGGAGSPRVINLYSFYCMMAAAFCFAYALGALGRRLSASAAGRGAKIACAALAATLAALSLSLAQPASYGGLVRDLANDEVSAYRAQTLAQFAALAEAAPGSDAVVIAGPYAPPSVAYVPFLPDPEHWASVAIADYFRLASVRAESAPASAPYR